MTFFVVCLKTDQDGFKYVDYLTEIEGEDEALAFAIVLEQCENGPEGSGRAEIRVEQKTY